MNVPQALCLSGRSGQRYDSSDMLLTLMNSWKRRPPDMKCTANMLFSDKESTYSLWAILLCIKGNMLLKVTMDFGNGHFFSKV